MLARKANIPSGACMIWISAFHLALQLASNNFYAVIFALVVYEIVVVDALVMAVTAFSSHLAASRAHVRGLIYASI